MYNLNTFLNKSFHICMWLFIKYFKLNLGENWEVNILKLKLDLKRTYILYNFKLVCYAVFFLKTSFNISEIFLKNLAMTWLPEYLSHVLRDYHLTILRKTTIILIYCSLGINSLILKIVEGTRNKSCWCNLLHIYPWNIALCTFRKELLPFWRKLVSAHC